MGSPSRITLDLRLGEIHALVGEKGAGKSTLMKVMCGVHTPSSGAFLLDREELSLVSNIDGERHGLVLLRQELNLAEDSTAKKASSLAASGSAAGCSTTRECVRNGA
jgi:ribose transport system ATP-binding protein